MFNANIRSYEVSIWTLQDSFIATLKPSNLESKGTVQDAEMVIKDDGTREFSFSIPMYYYVGPNKVENPNWYHTRNGNLIASMRKIKVIFNKYTDLEAVYEFIITDVTERHDNGELMCEVKCEGLAFHELGKIGYKISLSQDDFLEEWTAWATELYDPNDAAAVADHNAREPKNNINYWVEKVLKDTNWTYSIQMDWSYIDGKVIIETPYDKMPKVDEARVNIAKVPDFTTLEESYPMVNWAMVDRTHVWDGNMLLAELIPYSTLNEFQREVVNSARERDGLRRCDRVYEDEYVSSWHEENGMLTPTTTEPRREKMRLFDEEESNIYNLTQTIAETFGVHCKYVYHYNDDYHIIKREVVYYNNFLQETTGHVEITYPYSTVKIEREMDSTDLVTKMYVKPLEDTNLLAGSASIIDTPANKSGEDYLLNFDYLYSIGTISEQQYAEIAVYETKMHELNEQINPLSIQLIRYQNELTDVQAAKTNAYNAMSLDDERMSASDDALKAITNDTGVLVVDNLRPDMCVAMQDYPKETYYITIHKEGIIASTIEIYENYDSRTVSFIGDSVKPFDVEIDAFGNLTGKIYNLKGPDTEHGETVKVYYAAYTYEPKLYYDNIKRIWQIRKQQDEAEYLKQAAREAELDGEKDSDGNRISDGKIQEIEKQLQEIYNQKEQMIKAFERMMGPALREGTWQPEDDYVNYGDKYSINLDLTSTSQFQPELVSMGWDSELLDSEEKNYYEYSATQEKRYYPCIDLTNYLSRFTDANISAEASTENLTIESLSFVFQDMEYGSIEDARFFRYFSVGSQCEFAFIRKIGERTVKPVLMITGAKTMGEDFNFAAPAAHARVGYLKVTVSANGSSIDNDVREILSESEVRSAWIDTLDLANYEIVYPRIRIADENVKIAEDEISVMQNNGVLNNYEDYYIINREEKDITLPQYGYIVTIDPDMIIRTGKINNQYRINFSISNTGLLIYLDAIEVMKENAYPKVTYEVEPSILTLDFVKQAYNTLDKIIWLNDDELKLENVLGYISELDLDLDHPWEDKITITNYKTKFEDLFSNIVAQTEEMKKNSGIIGAAASIFTASGQISSDVIQGVLDSADLNYAFNQGTLTMDEANGIWGTSDDGVIAFRGGGIFTATEKDATGNWMWNTGILPSGINANLITTGQLNTNLIRIYAGNDLKFQMNSEGLFAYKSWLEDKATTTATLAAREEQYKNNPLNAGQYVVHNSEGLFLVAKAGAQVLIPEYTDSQGDIVAEHYTTVGAEDINRVSISWDGLTIKNWDNQNVFYADGNGNLNITGIITATGGVFTGEIKATELTIQGQSLDGTIVDLYSLNDSGLHNLQQEFVDELNLRFANLDEKVNIVEYMRFISSNDINLAREPGDAGYAYVFPGLYIGDIDSDGKIDYEAAMCTDGYFRVIETVYNDEDNTYTKVVRNAFGPTKHQFGTLNLYETSDGGHAFI